MKITSDTLMPIGLVLTVAVFVFYAGISYHQIGANAEDIEGLESNQQVMKDIQTRSIMTNENINVLLERQQRLLEGQDTQLDNQQRQIDRLQILIERLSREGGTMDP